MRIMSVRTMQELKSRKQTTITFPTQEELDFVRETADLLGEPIATFATKAIITHAKKLRESLAKGRLKCPTCGSSLKTKAA
jgi:hypothetical protein